MVRVIWTWCKQTKEQELELKYVCIYYVIFIRCDRRASNNKHKKQNRNDMQYRADKNRNCITLQSYIDGGGSNTVCRVAVIEGGGRMRNGHWTAATDENVPACRT